MLVPLVAKYYDERSSTVFFQTDSEGRRKINCFSMLQQGKVMGPVLFRTPLLPVLKRIQLERRGVEVFAYLDESALFPARAHEMDIAINSVNTVDLPPRGHVPMPKEFALLGGIGVHIVEGGEAYRW